MKRRLLLLLALVFPLALPAQLIHEFTSPYHHIRVVDNQGLRTLYFDDAMESTISLKNPLAGHFEYTEYFHMGWLWNTGITQVLMIGLGGGSAQRSFEHYYTNVMVESVEIDPAVLQIARTFFGFKESPRQKVHIEDGRMFLRRSTNRYDLIVLDAYIKGRYGSSVPQHLATRECFEIVRDHLTTNGVLAYNVIDTTYHSRPNLVGSIYKTLKAVFPQVYQFPARTSQNVVLLATKAAIRPDPASLRLRADELVRSGRAPLPMFRQRVNSLVMTPPVNVSNCPLLTDDYAPVEGLAGGN